MYRTKVIYQLSDLKQSSWKILRLFEIYRQSGSQAPVAVYGLLSHEEIITMKPFYCTTSQSGGIDYKLNWVYTVQGNNDNWGAVTAEQYYTAVANSLTVPMSF